MLATPIFILGSMTSRGGLYSDVSVVDKEQFLRLVEGWNQRIDEGARFYSYPTYRYAYLNGGGAAKLKNMRLDEFEAMFTEEDRPRLGRLLEYGRNYDKWPVFLKEVYLKYGHEYKGEN